MAGNLGRSVEDVENLIVKSKIDLNDLTAVSQTLVFGDNVVSDDNSMILLEVTPNILEELKLGEEFVIRGDANDTAVICSKNQTFELEEAETSNSLLVLPQFSLQNANSIEESSLTNRILYDREVTNIFHKYYEVQLCKPKLRKLQLLLEENPYQGPEYDKENCAKKYTYEDLLDCIQASETELKTELNRLPAFLIDGYYRVLDYDFKCTVSNSIFNLIDGNSCPINEIPKNVVLDTLEELFPREIVEQCFEMYAEHTPNNSEGIYQFKEAKVCQFYAEILLRSAGKFHLQEFLESWKKSVPEGLTTNLSQLKGLALTDLQSKPQVISYYPVCDLPEDIKARLEALFHKRRTWAFEDIKPYVEDLATEKLNVNALLTKHARCFAQNGVKMCNSKH